MQLHALLRNQAEETELRKGSSLGLAATITSLTEAAEAQTSLGTEATLLVQGRIVWASSG